MSTLSELIHYCKEPDPVGALLLTGEWGCGKTYLIDNDLAETLKDTHIIVRVSLFGMKSPEMLHERIRQKWFEACLPVLGALRRARDNTEGILTAANGVIRAIDPVAGSAAEVMMSLDALDFVAIKPEVEEFLTHKRKRVILVYDDFERVKMDPLELLGVINDYCENKQFNTIISANEEHFKKAMVTDGTAYHMLREKTISQSIYHIPDYYEIIDSIISERQWPSEEYAEYLAVCESVVQDLFVSESDESVKALLSGEIGRCHNFRNLTKGLDSFYRVYYHMNKNGKGIPDAHLYSFLALFLASKSGIYKGGELTLDFDDGDIQKAYPKYSADDITDAERNWIATGIWDKEGFVAEITA